MLFLSKNVCIQYLCNILTFKNVVAHNIGVLKSSLKLKNVSILILWFLCEKLF